MAFELVSISLPVFVDTSTFGSPAFNVSLWYVGSQREWFLLEAVELDSANVSSSS